MALSNVYNDASLRGETSWLTWLYRLTHAISHTYAKLRLVRRKTLVELTHGELSLDKKLGRSLTQRLSSKTCRKRICNENAPVVGPLRKQRLAESADGHIVFCECNHILSKKHVFVYNRRCISGRTGIITHQLLIRESIS